MEKSTYRKYMELQPSDNKTILNENQDLNIADKRDGAKDKIDQIVSMIYEIFNDGDSLFDDIYDDKDEPQSAFKERLQRAINNLQNSIVVLEKPYDF